jgi:hypothetical protein
VVDGAGRAPPPSDRPPRGAVVDGLVDGFEALGALGVGLVAGESVAVLSCGEAMAKPPASTSPEVTATPPAISRARAAGCLAGLAGLAGRGGGAAGEFEGDESIAFHCRPPPVSAG